MVIEIRGVLLALLGASAIDAWAAVYTCIGKDGVQRRSVCPIAECANRDQRFPYPDASPKGLAPSTPTPDEQAACEARSARLEAVASDRNLKKRYPNEEAHRKKRQEDLRVYELAMSNSRARLEQLATERTLLLEQAELFRDRSMPQELKNQIAANDASTAAHLNVLEEQQAEQTRINQHFDIELERLRKLWSGAQPGSLWQPPPRLRDLSNGGQPGSLWPPQP